MWTKRAHITGPLQNIKSTSISSLKNDTYLIYRWSRKRRSRCMYWWITTSWLKVPSNAGVTTRRCLLGTPLLKEFLMNMVTLPTRVCLPKWFPWKLQSKMRRSFSNRPKRKISGSILLNRKGISLIGQKVSTWTSLISKLLLNCLTRLMKNDLNIFHILQSSLRNGQTYGSWQVFFWWMRDVFWLISVGFHDKLSKESDFLTN